MHLPRATSEIHNLLLEQGIEAMVTQLNITKRSLLSQKMMWIASKKLISITNCEISKHHFVFQWILISKFYIPSVESGTGLFMENLILFKLETWNQEHWKWKEKTVSQIIRQFLKI